MTSQPISRVVDYYFSLVPELDTPERASEAVSLVDGRNEPLEASRAAWCISSGSSGSSAGPRSG